MTASSNITGDTITVTDADGKELTVALDQATDLITKLLAARKAGYDARRTAAQAVKAAAKAERETKKAERTAAQAAKKAETLKKLEERLAALKAAA